MCASRDMRGPARYLLRTAGQNANIRLVFQQCERTFQVPSFRKENSVKFPQVVGVSGQSFESARQLSAISSAVHTPWSVSLNTPLVSTSL